jgi:hypothetical protein
MHVVFLRRDANARRLLQSRRLLMAVHTAAANKEMKEVEGKLQVALAAELHLSVNDLKASTQVGDQHYHTTFLFKGLKAIALGHQLETAVLANQFNPLPSHPIHRLAMEEVFDCGAHAVGATHPYDGTNDGGVKWLMPDPTRHPSFTPSSTPIDTPTPTRTPVWAASRCKKVCAKDKCKGTWTNPIPSGHQWTTVSNGMYTSSRGCCAFSSGACATCCH